MDLRGFPVAFEKKLPASERMHDTALIASYLDAGILVVRQDCAPVNRIMAGTEILAQAELPLVGRVLNGVSAGLGHYGYGYGYGHYGHYEPYGETK